MELEVSCRGQCVLEYHALLAFCFVLGDGDVVYFAYLELLLWSIVLINGLLDPRRIFSLVLTPSCRPRLLLWRLQRVGVLWLSNGLYLANEGGWLFASIYSDVSMAVFVPEDLHPWYPLFIWRLLSVDFFSCLKNIAVVQLFFARVWLQVRLWTIFRDPPLIFYKLPNLDCYFFLRRMTCECLPLISCDITCLLWAVLAAHNPDGKVTLFFRLLSNPQLSLVLHHYLITIHRGGGCDSGLIVPLPKISPPTPRTLHRLGTLGRMLNVNLISV